MRQLLDSRFVTPASNIDIDIDDIGDNYRLIEVPLIDSTLSSNVSQSYSDTSESTLRCNDMRLCVVLMLWLSLLFVCRRVFCVRDGVESELIRRVGLELLLDEVPAVASDVVRSTVIGIEWCVWCV